MSDDWDEIGYVISSTHRTAVLGRLDEGPATPAQLASDTDLAVTHVSRVLSDLRERSLVELLVPEERRKGRVYGITERGRDVWSTIQKKDLVD